MSSPTFPAREDLPDLMDAAHAEVHELLDDICKDVDRVERAFTEAGEECVDDLVAMCHLALLLRVARSTIQR